MSDKPDDEPSSEDRQDLRDNNPDDSDNPMPANLKEALVTKKPGIKPS